MPQTHYIRLIPKPHTIKRIGRIHEALYRATGGRIGGRLDGLDILLLTTVGKKSGLPRTVPLPYFRDGQRYVLIASFGGDPQNPAWLSNLLSNPRVDLQVGSRKLKGQAVVTQGAERARLWDDVTREFPRYSSYQAKTERIIPVVSIDAR